MARKFLMLLIVVVTTSNLFAQAPKNNGTIAPFVITLDDGKVFKAEELKKAPVMLVYFSPECDHCKNFTKQLVKNSKSFSDRQIVMITYLSVDEVKNFVKTFDLSSHHNIKVGTEANTFLVRNYYNVEHFPFVALYDKTGKEVKLFANQPSIKDVLKAANKSR